MGSTRQIRLALQHSENNLELEDELNDLPLVSVDA